MSFTAKIDVLDLLIDLLKEHENKLDTLIEKMEIIDHTINKNPRLRESVKEYNSESKPQVTQSILVVDDDKNLANSFKLILESVGYNVETAYTGLQALYKVNKEEFDLVLLDLNLPDMMGDRVAEEIKEGSEYTDIVFITGHPSPSHIDENDVMMKPINPEYLLETATNRLTNN
jgi:CheY-like chemotaxis protein